MLLALDSTRLDGLCYNFIMRCSNIPSQLSTFVGREREIATAKRLLGGTRLLTLTGPGGCGKTRLALAVAEGLVRRYADGVWLVELAPLSDPDLVPEAIASALNLRETPGRPLLETLIAYLKTRHLLLLLDNCEHLIDACAGLTQALLTACPRLRILATSREPLRVPGEITWPVPPLGLPELKNLPALPELVRVEAVQLYIERARRTWPAFTLDGQNALPICQTCCWLAGSPLAIELAAARIRVLSPEQIAARLENVLGLLATGDRTVPPRHRTLQATLDWSYNLLSSDEQSLFRRLSVFAGSFSVEAAEAICATGECHEGLASPHPPKEGARDHGSASVLDLLAGLVDKSLLEVESEAGPDRRYRYLEPVQQYARARLEHAGDEASARDRLLAWAVALAERVGPGTYRRSAKRDLEQLDVELANLRAALEWGLTAPIRTVLGHRLACALGQFWQSTGHICEGLAWLEQFLSAPGDVPVPLRIDTLHKAGFLAIHALDLKRARRYLGRGLELARAREDRWGLGQLYTHLCWLVANEGDLDEAECLCDEALSVSEQSDDDWGRAMALFLRANVDYLQHDYAKARKDVEESIAICRDIGYAPAYARRQVRLGQICQAQGDDEGAKRCTADGLRTSRETGDSWGTAMAIAAIAGLARHQGQHERAAWLLGVTQHFRDAFGVPFWIVDELEYARNRAELRSLLGEAPFEKAIAFGAQQADRDLDATLQAVLAEGDRSETREHASGRQSSSPQPALGDSSPLSRREREVAALVAQGKSNAEIAAALFVGLRTVEAHVTHILNKLGFSSRSQIAAWISRDPTASSPDLPTR